MNDDRAAIRRVKQGDREAFRVLVERYEREALAHARAILASREDALEAVQEAFFDAYRSIGRFDEERAFYPWLYVILRNRCFARLKSTQKESATSQLPHGRGELIADTSGDAARAVELEDALLALSSGDREILLLKHLDGLTYLELAERLGVPAGTVMSRLYHARRRLAEVLEISPAKECK